MADVAASVLAKLRNKAKASGISYQQCLQLFVQEEFLRKLSKSGCEDTLILKGGLFIYTLTNFESRATIDVDFLLRGYSNSIDDVKELICKIIDTPTGNDYIEMRAKGFEEISPQRKYHGISTQIIAQIKNVRVPFNVDIGVGDIIVPRAEERTINTQLPDFEAPVIKTYSLESTIAEKFDAILQRFELTGRMKDFYDIYYLSRTFDFDGAKLQAAIFETLQRRGTPYDRDSFKRVVALADDEDMQKRYAHCEKLITELRNSISIATEELEELKEKYNGVSLEIQSIEQKVRNSQQLLSYSSFYKNKGQYEIYESCKRQLEVLQGEIDSYVSKIAIIDEKINEKKSKERFKDIREDIEGYCRTLADAINLPKTFIKLRDFVQIIDRTGSETPRLVYMYQSALYLYNLYRTNSPFNFYVVDTPNQQGQDAENLGSIFKSLELFLSDEGQVIVGTERETGLEGKASNVIKLTEKRRCLNTINYSKHLELLEELQKTAISWVAFNHKAKNEK